MQSAHLIQGFMVCWWGSSRDRWRQMAVSVRLQQAVQDGFGLDFDVALRV